MKILSFIYKLLFDRKNNQKDSSTPELFHSDNYLRPDYENYRKCPKCMVEAKTNKEIVDIFGVMHINSKPKFQSWCRKCRNEEKNDKFNDNENVQNKIDL